MRLETKAILDEIERGKSFVVTRNGRVVARIKPVVETETPSWDELMAEVWRAQTQVRRADIRKNPVLLEGRRRRR